MALSKTQIITSAWDTLYTYFQTTLPLSTDNIYSAYPEKKDLTYPVVIINPVMVSKMKLSMNGNLKSIPIKTSIDIYHNSSQNVKAIADEVLAGLDTGETTFNTAGMCNMNVNDTDDDYWQEGNKRVHVITIPVEFMWVMSK